MRAKRNPEITVDEVRAALEASTAGALLAVLYQLTGDHRWVTDRYRPARPRGLEDPPGGGLAPDILSEIREAACDAVVRWHRGAPALAGDLRGTDLHDLMSFTMGREVVSEYPSIFQEDLALVEETSSPRASDGRSSPRVVIVGAGLSGLTLGAELARRGIHFTILEQNHDVGGVWLSNVYPGAGLDTPSHLYTLRTFPREWRTHFAKQPEVLEYLGDFADAHGLRRFIRFGSRVQSADFDPDRGTWSIAVEAQGQEMSVDADVLVSAVGTFAEPAIPEFSGLSDFRGDVLHSARWPAGTDLTGRRVAVVGSGASAMQLVPRIVEDVSELLILQRTPQWVAPVGNYFEEVAPDVNALFDLVPRYWEWYRFRLAAAWNDGAYPALLVDPDWPEYPASVNAVNASQRRFYERYLRAELAGRDDLIESSVPSYPPFGKRILLDNGWFAALRKEHVSLVPHGLAAVTETGVIDATGEEHDVDTIVFATGFSATDYLRTLAVTSGGVALSDVWANGEAAAYLGMAVPGFPNLFIMYGPNIHPIAGGSYLFMGEIAAAYIADAVEHLVADPGSVLEVRQDVFAAYQNEVDEANRERVWGVDAVDSYTKNASGRVVIGYPWRVSDYWVRASEFRRGDYVSSES